VSNTSATGGYLTPNNAAPPDDQDLDRIFHDLFTGIAGIDATLVRPRWTIEPGNMPPLGSSWIAQGVVERRDDPTVTQWFTDGIGTTVIRQQEIINLLSFYGTGAAALEAVVRDGLYLDQNREAIGALGLSLVIVGNARNASMLINERWNKRIDVQITFRRTIKRIYPILSLLSGSSTEYTDSYTTNITVNQ
jgi:hypothetical protein